MRTFVAMTFIIGLTVCDLNCAKTAKTHDLLKLSISSDKTVYQVGEPTTITVVLENVSEMQITVNKRLEFVGPEVYLEIQDETGNLLKWLPPDPPPPLTKDDFIVVSPGETAGTRTIHIERHLSERLKPGRHTLKATYKNAEDGSRFGLNAWTGMVMSNTITFDVRKGPSQ